jgi:hypothetical protein
MAREAQRASLICRARLLPCHSPLVGGVLGQFCSIDRLGGGTDSSNARANACKDSRHAREVGNHTLV